MQQEFDVAIVGYGPTGLVLASALGRAGHRVVVFERWPCLYGMPRLTHIDGETARIIQSVGDVDLALRDSWPVPHYRYVNATGELLVELDMGGRSCGFPAHISMYQPHIETAIDQQVRSCPGVEVNQGTIVVALREHEDSVELTVRPWSRSRTEQWSEGAAEPRTVTAKYVVGADGANSFIRTTLGIDRVDLGVDDRWLNIDVERLRPLGAEFDRLIQFCDPARGRMHMPIGRSRQRFECAVLPGEDAAPFETAEYAWRWLHQTHGLGPADVRILRQVVYTFQAKIAEQWRRGRVFLAGDAAHTTPPYLGQGACSGMRDGITLAWKLDLVLKGRAAEALLDTYEAERRPHATAITETSVALGNIANTHDPEVAAARDAAFRDGTAPPPPPFPTLVAGVVHHRGDGQLSAHAGTLAPQGVVRSQRGTGRFDDVVGGGFAVVSVREAANVLSGAHLDFLTALGAVTATVEPGTAGSVHDIDGTYDAFFADKKVEAFISRPDFHLYWAGAMVELPAALDTLRAQLSFVGAPTPAGTSA